MNKLIYILTLFLFAKTQAQEVEKTKWKIKENISINGYVKYIPSISFKKQGKIEFDNLIHNRINIKAFLGENISVKVGLRNRIFFGETVKNTPNYGNLIAIDAGELDLSFLTVNEKSFVIHTIFDRAYIDYSKDKWQVSLGRQRINWGINLAWNTNDLFNAYNIVDFDYEEKAGTDAIRVQYYAKKGTVDVAYKTGKNIEHSVIASRYKFNKWKYDFQILAANYYEDIAIGTGWAGNIKKAGFKGEVTYFKNKKNADDVASISTSVDYFFKKGTYLNISALYTSNGTEIFNPSVLNFATNDLSAKELMPTKYSYLVQLSNEFNPRLKGNLTSIYGQGMNLFFVMPSIDYSVKENWDINLTGQIFYVKQHNEFKNLNNTIYLRIQYSF